VFSGAGITIVISPPPVQLFFMAALFYVFLASGVVSSVPPRPLTSGANSQSSPVTLFARLVIRLIYAPHSGFVRVTSPRFFPPPFEIPEPRTQVYISRPFPDQQTFFRVPSNITLLLCHCLMQALILTYFITSFSFLFSEKSVGRDIRGTYLCFFFFSPDAIPLLFSVR